MLLIFVNYDVHKLGSLQSLHATGFNVQTLDSWDSLDSKLQSPKFSDQVRRLKFINFISQESIFLSFATLLNQKFWWGCLRIESIASRAVSKRFSCFEQGLTFQSMKRFHWNAKQKSQIHSSYFRHQAASSRRCQLAMRLWFQWRLSIEDSKEIASDILIGQLNRLIAGLSAELGESNSSFFELKFSFKSNDRPNCLST